MLAADSSTSTRQQEAEQNRPTSCGNQTTGLFHLVPPDRSYNESCGNLRGKMLAKQCI